MQIRVDSKILSLHINEVCNAASRLTDGLSELDTSGLKGLSALNKYKEVNNRLISLVEQYQSLVQKDMADVHRMLNYYTEVDSVSPFSDAVIIHFHHLPGIIPYKFMKLPKFSLIDLLPAWRVDYEVDVRSLRLVLCEFRCSIYRLQASLYNLQSCFVSLIGCSQLNGRGADGLRDYINNMHIPMIKRINELCRLLTYKFIVYVNEYEGAFGPTGYFEEGELSDINRSFDCLDRISRDFDDEYRSILSSAKIANMGILVDIGKIWSQYEGIYKIKKDIETTYEKIEKQHLDSDFSDMENRMSVMERLITSGLNKNRNYGFVWPFTKAAMYGVAFKIGEKVAATEVTDVVEKIPFEDKETLEGWKEFVDLKEIEEASIGDIEITTYENPLFTFTPGEIFREDVHFTWLYPIKRTRWILRPVPMPSPWIINPIPRIIISRPEIIRGIIWPAVLMGNQYMALRAKDLYANKDTEMLPVVNGITKDVIGIKDDIAENENIAQDKFIVTGNITLEDLKNPEVLQKIPTDVVADPVSWIEKGGSIYIEDSGKVKFEFNSSRK